MHSVNKKEKATCGRPHRTLTERLADDRTYKQNVRRRTACGMEPQQNCGYGRKEIAAAWPQLHQLRYDRKWLKTARKEKVQVVAVFRKRERAMNAKEKTLLRYGPAYTSLRYDRKERELADIRRKERTEGAACSIAIFCV